MKREIMKLLRQSEGYLSINKFCALHRYTKDALGREVDVLNLEISISTSYDYIIEIKSRDFKDVVDEIKQYQTKAFKEIAEKFNEELENGYLSR